MKYLRKKNKLCGCTYRWRERRRREKNASNKCRVGYFCTGKKTSLSFVGEDGATGGIAYSAALPTSSEASYQCRWLHMKWNTWGSEGNACLDGPLVDDCPTWAQHWAELFFGNTKVCSKCMELKMIHNAGYSFLGKLSLKLCCWGLAKLSLRFSIGGGAAPWKVNFETTIYILNVHATSCGYLVSWNI